MNWVWISVDPTVHLPCSKRTPASMAHMRIFSGGSIDVSTLPTPYCFPALPCLLFCIFFFIFSRLRSLWYMYADTNISNIKPKTLLDKERK